LQFARFHRSPDILAHFVKDLAKQNCLDIYLDKGLIIV
jgi:hypothetical protein